MKMKRIQLLVIALAVLMVLTACSTKQSDNSNSKSGTKETPQESKTSDTNKKLAKLYTKVLDNVDNYDFGQTEGLQVLGYEYALVNMKGIDIPLLFVSQRTDFKKWFFGHFHEDLDIGEQFHCVFDDIIRLPE